jgi:hypothetical protein
MNKLNKSGHRRRECWPLFLPVPLPLKQDFIRTKYSSLFLFLLIHSGSQSCPLTPPWCSFPWLTSSSVLKIKVIDSYEESVSPSDDKVSHSRRKCSSALSLLYVHRGPALAWNLKCFTSWCTWPNSGVMDITHVSYSYAWEHLFWQVLFIIIYIFSS